MNERIRELAAQAGYAPLKPRTFADDLQDIFLQKFAELIVRECIDRINRVGILEDVEFQSGMIAQNVREQFGINK